MDGTITKCSTKGLQSWKRELKQESKYGGTCEAMSGTNDCEISADELVELDAGCEGKIEGCTFGAPVLVEDPESLNNILTQQGYNISGHFGTGNQLFPDRNNNNQISCSKPCDGGYAVTARYIQNTDGTDCGSLTNDYITNACNTHECPVNCTGSFVEVPFNERKREDVLASTCLREVRGYGGLSSRWARHRLYQYIVKSPKRGAGTCVNEGKYKVGSQVGCLGGTGTRDDGTVMCPGLGLPGTLGTLNTTNKRFVPINRKCKCLLCGKGGADITYGSGFCGDVRVSSIAKDCSPTQPGPGCYGKVLSKDAPIASCDCAKGSLVV